MDDGGDATLLIHGACCMDLNWALPGLSAHGAAWALLATLPVLLCFPAERPVLTATHTRLTSAASVANLRTSATLLESLQRA